MDYRHKPTRGGLKILDADGHSREAAAEANGMTRQTLRDWVHRFNADGVTGLRSRTSPGRPPALNETRMETHGLLAHRHRPSRGDLFAKVDTPPTHHTVPL
jgi:transposase